MSVLLSGDAKVYIRNNVFYQQINKAIHNFGNSGTSEIIAEYNSFLSTDRIALRLENNNISPNNITAINNYWNTTDTNVIDAMILDRNDDLAIAEFIEYKPFLSAPHLDTPTIKVVAECGDDQVVFDSVTLDGSASYDQLGMAITFHWQLEHRENATHNRISEGINPTVSDIVPGFYDVTLTVTNNFGETDTDIMMVAAIGCKGDFYGDGSVDGLDLAEFAENFGRTDCPSCD
jgi:hypothetical protein